MKHAFGIGAVILAAGASRRLGTPKQLLVYEAEPLIRRTARIASSAGFLPVVVVIGHEAARVRAAVADLPLAIVENEEWPSGMGSSIALGVSELTRHSGDGWAVALLVSDQPLVTRDHLRALSAAVSDGAPLSASVYAGTEGVPAIFGPAIIPELLAMRGETGAKAVLRRHLSSAALLPFGDGEFDIDTPADLARVRHLTSLRATRHD